jgi:hypothetical protein
MEVHYILAYDALTVDLQWMLLQKVVPQVIFLLGRMIA